MPGKKNWMIHGQELTDEQMKAAKKNGVSQATVYYRVLHGWTREEAVSAPPGTKRGEQDEPQEQNEQDEQGEKIDRAEERADIAGFASEIGLSYGRVVSYLDGGMSKEEIKEKYGKTYERTPHRWAKKEEETMSEPKKTILRREEIEIRCQSEHFSFLLRDDWIRITFGKTSHLKIEKKTARELAQALMEIAEEGKR